MKLKEDVKAILAGLAADAERVIHPSDTSGRIARIESVLEGLLHHHAAVAERTAALEEIIQPVDALPAPQGEETTA